MSKGETTRQQIINEAMRQSVSLGFEGISLGGLAGSLAMSKSGLYAHFKSKEALQLAILEEAIARFIQAVTKPAMAKPKGLERLRAVFMNYLDWIQGDKTDLDGCIFMTLAQEYSGKPGPIRDLLVASQQQWRTALQQLAEQAFPTKRQDAEQFTFEMIGVALSFQQSWKLIKDPSALQRAQQAFEHLISRYQSE
ncbi:MAG: TetR/AcrR family transcriptional regulator [Cellvibrionaceae bacterium]